tara:strand:+ start:687 stop:860 length:174 start_codon:yes stop_codon:yes gene_type:complete
MIHDESMFDPILYISMILGLGGVLVLINSFSDDDDSDNDGGKGIYIYDFEPARVSNN